MTYDQYMGTLRDKIFQILLQEPKARDNDNLLIWLVWANESYAIHQVLYSLGEDFVSHLPLAENIRRTRQKIQEDGLTLQPSPEVKALRRAKQEKMRSHFSSRKSSQSPVETEVR